MAKIETKIEPGTKQVTAFEKLMIVTIREALHSLCDVESEFILTVKVNGMMCVFSVTPPDGSASLGLASIVPCVEDIVKPFAMGFTIFSKYHIEDNTAVFAVQRFDIKKEQLTLNYYAPSPLKAQN